MNLLKLVSKIYSKQLQDIGSFDPTVLNSLNKKKSYKGCYNDGTGVQYVFIQIGISIYSIQILFLSDSSDTFRDKLALRASRLDQDTFNGIPWTWIKTATVA